MSKQLLVSISILISNRPDTVKKCLESVKPILDQVPSELILVDTGCGEEVRGIIETYADKIVDFEWCRDFSKARNAGLRQAKGKWFMFLDDDEWFDDVTEIITFFNSGEYRKYGLGVYTQRSYMDQAGLIPSDLMVARMIRLDPDVKFIYKIHECFNKVPGKTKMFDVFVHHYGYAYNTEEERKAHSMRNITLLLEEHEEHPRNMKHTLQLAQEYNVIDEYEKSLEMSLDGISVAAKGPVEDEFCLSSLYGNEINCYIKLKRYDDVVERGRQHLASRRTDPVVKALIAGNMANVYLYRGDYENCLKYVEQYWDTCVDYQKDIEKYMGFETTITNSCFDQRKRSIVLGDGIRAAVHFGRGELAWEWFQSINSQSKMIFISNEMIRSILERMPEAAPEELDYYVRMCDMLLAREELRDFVIQAMSECCDRKGSFEEQVKAMSCYAKVASGEWFFRLAKIVVSAFLPGRGQTCSLEEAEELVAGVWEDMQKGMPLIRKYHMLEALECLGGKRGKILEAIPFYLWQRGIVGYFQSFTKEDAVWWNGQFKAALAPDSMRMLVWRAFYGLTEANLEATALEASEGTGMPEDAEAMGIRRMIEGLREYASCHVELCEKIFLPDIISQMPDVLPEDYQGSYFVLDLLKETEEEKYDAAVQTVKVIRRLLPGLTEIMKQYLKWLQRQLERQKVESRKVAEGLQTLSVQIKNKIHQLMGIGQNQAALGVANQLLALTPNDAELQQLIERLQN